MTWSENVILADATFLDKLTFEFTVYFERILERRVQKADLATWLDCAALDGGLLPGNNQTQAIFLHDAEVSDLKNFTPSSFQDEIDGKAFTDNMGEFTLHAATSEGIAAMDEFFVQSLELIANASDVKRIILAPDMMAYGTKLLAAISKTEGKDITVLVGEPQPVRGFKEEKIAYSLMTALGIRGDELP